MRTRLGLACALPLLAACAITPPVGVSAAAGGGECRNDALGGFTGRAATADLGTEILGASGARTLQWIPAGTMVTMEFRADRVRVSLDEANKVTSARCG